MSEHTPLPWKQDDKYPTHIVTLDDLSILATSCVTRRADEWEANAEYIVRACNLFPELVAALDDTVPAMRDEYERHNGSKRTGCLCAYCDRYRMVTYLLAKARDES